MFVWIAAAVFIADDAEAFAQCGGEIGSRINHERTLIDTNEGRQALPKIETIGASFVSIRG